MSSQEQKVQLLVNVVESLVQNPENKKDLRRIVKSLPYSFTLLEESKSTLYRIQYKLDLALTLLNSDPFEKVKEFWYDHILVAILVHDAWEHNGPIAEEIDETHAVAGAREIRDIANTCKSGFLSTVADLVETHEGAKLSDLKYPHLMAVPQTLPQKFVYHIVQTIDHSLLPNIAYEMFSSVGSYSSLANEDMQCDREVIAFDHFRASLEKVFKQ